MSLSQDELVGFVWRQQYQLTAFTGYFSVSLPAIIDDTL